MTSTLECATFWVIRYESCVSQELQVCTGQAQNTETLWHGWKCYAHFLIAIICLECMNYSRIWQRAVLQTRTVFIQCVKSLGIVAMACASSSHKQRPPQKLGLSTIFLDLQSQRMNKFWSLQVKDNLRYQLAGFSVANPDALIFKYSHRARTNHPNILSVCSVALRHGHFHLHFKSRSDEPTKTFLHDFFFQFFFILILNRWLSNDGLRQARGCLCSHCGGWDHAMVEGWPRDQRCHR